MTHCKICKSENIRQFEEAENISYKGKTLPISMKYSVCNDCEREFISKQQILKNDSRVRDAKKRIDGLLTSTEIADARKSLGLTQEQASLVFGGGKNAFSKYERAKVSQSVAMDKLIRICLQHQSIFNELLVISGIEVATTQLTYKNNVIPYPKNKRISQSQLKIRSIALVKDVSYG